MKQIQSPNPRGNPNWKAGVTGNANGRPVAVDARRRFSAAFLNDLADVWAEHGHDAMLSTARLNPAVFFATCARLIPSDVKLTVEQSFGGLSPDDYAIPQAIKEALPGANDRPPSEVLQLTLEAIQAHQAKTIEG